MSLGLSEGELIEGVRQPGRERPALSRFGPLWNAERLGGDVCLAAMAVPADRFETVAAQVNAHPEVAHNYERGHTLNMWFVLATERPSGSPRSIAEIEAETGLEVFPMPKTREFFVGFRVEV